MAAAVFLGVQRIKRQPHAAVRQAGAQVAQHGTARVDAQGRLSWQAPAGNWTMLRLGYAPIGTLNRSAPDTGVGLECDKYSKAAVLFHFDKMMARLPPALGPLAERGAVGLEIDSCEVGMQH